MSVSVFPVDVAAKPAFRDDWGEPRGGGTRGHKGTDIFAPRGTSVLATADGVARAQTEDVGGNALYLVEADGTQHYFAHLDGYAGEFPRRVKAGDVVAYVGNTGNAAGGATHLHFELRPRGGEKVDPYESLRSVFPGGPLARVPQASVSRSRASAAGGGALAFLVLLWAVQQRKRGR